MADNQEYYSRFVAWLKIILPLIALGLLSSLFLLSRSSDLAIGIKFSDEELVELGKGLRLTKPRFSGVSADGDAFIISADQATPNSTPPTSVSATNIVGLIETIDGGQIDVLAQDGMIDTLADLAELTGGTELTTSSGYRALTEALTMSLARVHITSDGPVHAIGPLGTIDAGAMEITTEPGKKSETSSKGYVLLFENGVKLVYQP